MANIEVDGVQYNLDDLSDHAKGQFASLRFVEAEIERLNAQLAVFKTAHIAYGTELKKSLPKKKK